VWLLGFFASMVVLPHRVSATELRLWHGYISDLVVPITAIRAARPAQRGGAKGGRVVVDETSGEAMFANNTASVALDLDPEVPLLFRGRPVGQRIETLYVSADDPGMLVAALA
jgi:hypothetical protein